MRIYGLMNIRYYINCIYNLIHLHILPHMSYIYDLTHTYNLTRTYGLPIFRYSNIPIFHSSVWRDPIRIQCGISFLLWPYMDLYNLYGLNSLGIINSYRCNSNTKYLDTLPLTSPYFHLLDTSDSHYSN